MSPAAVISVSASDEWSKLRSVIVGRASKSCFPSEPEHMIQATMPNEHHKQFHSPPRPANPFPADLLARADAELDNLAEVLKSHGVEVHRPEVVDFQKVGGYTAAMPRDGLMTVGDRVIEACFAWQCRKHEIELSSSRILDELAAKGAWIVRAPRLAMDTIYDGKVTSSVNSSKAKDGQVSANGSTNGKPTANGHNNGIVDDHEWAINNTRPAFDCADFVRCGKTLIGQLSNVTNKAGVEYVRDALPEGYSVELLDVNDPHAMHIDATLLPLRHGLLVFNPERVTEQELRRHEVFHDWKLIPYPYTPTNVGDTKLFMTSPWIVMNVLSIDENTIIAEEKETQFAEWIEAMGINVVKVPFRAVNAIGGSIHCATVDLWREG
jgi:glycine amidinotransferase